MQFGSIVTALSLVTKGSGGSGEGQLGDFSYG